MEKVILNLAKTTQLKEKINESYFTIYTGIRLSSIVSRCEIIFSTQFPVNLFETHKKVCDDIQAQKELSACIYIFSGLLAWIQSQGLLSTSNEPASYVASGHPSGMQEHACLIHMVT